MRYRLEFQSNRGQWLPFGTVMSLRDGEGTVAANFPGWVKIGRAYRFAPLEGGEPVLGKRSAPPRPEPLPAA